MTRCRLGCSMSAASSWRRTSDRGDVAALALLDLSAAFDTVDHGILLRPLRESYNMSGAKLTWISSYVTGRRQCVVHSGSQSYRKAQSSRAVAVCIYSWSRASDPETQCTLSSVRRRHQVYGWCQPHDASPSHCKTACQYRWRVAVDEQQQTAAERAHDWVLVWWAPARRRHHIPSSDVKVGPDCVHPVQSTIDFGVYIDSDSHDDDDSHQSCPVIVFQWTATDTMHQAVPAVTCTGQCPKVSSACDGRDRLMDRVDTLVSSLVHSQLDYCNFVFAGLPARDLQRLQSVLNAAVRLVSIVFIKSLSCHTPGKRSSLAIHQTACAVQAVHASPPLFVRRGTIVSRRAGRLDCHCKQQSWTEVSKVAVHHCATHLLDTQRSRVFRRYASSPEQPPIAHKTYLLHGRFLRELEILSVYMCILTVMFQSVFCRDVTEPVKIRISHIRISYENPSDADLSPDQN